MTIIVNSKAREIGLAQQRDLLLKLGDDTGPNKVARYQTVFYNDTKKRCGFTTLEQTAVTKIVDLFQRFLARFFSSFSKKILPNTAVDTINTSLSKVDALELYTDNELGAETL